MPAFMKHYPGEDPKMVYELPLTGQTIDAETVYEIRKEATERREALVSAQKVASSGGDYASARVISDMAKDAMREYRAACLVIGWYGSDPLPGDCKTLPPSSWPVDLADELDRAWRAGQRAN